MNDEINKEEVEKKTYSKKIPVQVISSKDKTSLVKYLDGDTLYKVYIPTTKLSEDEVEESILSKGIPYGLPFENVKLPEITGAELAYELHKRDIWTAEEFRRNPDGVRAAINHLYGKPLAILTTFVRKEKAKI